jgi:hypothetical protein
MTWSILARDAQGCFGVAIASRVFAVRALCVHTRRGVGALATQTQMNPVYGPASLALLTEGRSAAEVVITLTAADAGRDHRQLHLLPAAGPAAVHTGGLRQRKASPVPVRRAMRPTALRHPSRAVECQEWVECRYSLCAAGRQLCATDLPLKAQRRQCEGQPSLVVINWPAALGQLRLLPTVRFRRPNRWLASAATHPRHR